MQWSPKQDAALLKVSRWLTDSDQQVFRVFGHAGSGKTTLARHFAETQSGTFAYGAYTGKAALVMRQRGCVGATTLHRLAYKPQMRSASKLQDMLAERDTEPDGSARADRLDWLIKEEREALAAPSFSVQSDSILEGLGLLVVDECSMVNKKMGNDLMQFGCKILVLGDPAQLPPVGGEGFFTNCEPDVMLDEIHRQALESPVIRLATDVREGRRLSLGDYGTSRVVPKGALTDDDLLGYDQIIVGRNKTRKASNRFIRKLLGFEGHLPMPDDRLVCLRNNHDEGLLNGQLWNVAGAYDLGDVDAMSLDLVDPDDDKNQLTTLGHKATFEDRHLEYFDRLDANEFDFGYALTCHKSQGSQWQSVLVRDESECFRPVQRNWLYTALTRAADRVTVIKD